MIGLGISILWFALGVILVAACIYAAIWGISQFVAVDGRIIKLVWVVFAILCMIYLLITIEGGGVSGFRPLFPHSGLLIIPSDRIGVLPASYGLEDTSEHSSRGRPA